jgi:two-component system cell cycle response regulator DivK
VIEKKSILICDDDADLIGICRHILEKSDYEVISCERAERIFIQLTTTTPNIIFMDIGMSGIGGESAVLMIKEDNRYKHIPLVLFSANEEIEEIAIKTKADGYLKKPFEMKRMKLMIETLCN